MAAPCPSCGVENPEGKKFCGDCGASLVLACAACGAELVPGKKFCGDCGTPVAGGGAATTPASAPAAPASTQVLPGDLAPVRRVAERRLTTILFGDLVGFTSLSEDRDAEDTRELLSHYFAMASTVVTRYGGTIEKFIGDAVMAVWGVPVAHEDDAERAVRAGLDLIAEMADLGETVGVPGLSMRIGILTGEVAVTLGAVGEGMVAGDAVNTASRIQAAAEPGQVWVDETTRSLTSAAVNYVDAGEHLLKGKAEPVRLHAARAIVAAVGGAQRVDGLEAPFAGRQHDLRLVKELFHAVIDEGRPRHVAVFGAAGVGKSRLSWEFEKYIDGITVPVRWHRSRVLSYGDGVSFWALAEMVRSRLGIADGESLGSSDEKLTSALQRFITDRNERDWVRPRLAALLGLESARADGVNFSRTDLFSAWTTFFERVSEGDRTVVIVLDDMQYADPDLLDFLDHLMDEASIPLFLLTLARPELLDARPGWGSTRRTTSIHLEPMSETVMGEIVDGLVQGLPAQARTALVERSEGIPLYALEMVRGLIDQDAVIPRDGRYVLAPDAEQRVDLVTLDAPASLQALIAARLDALSPDERQVVQDATVHGLSFSRDGLGHVSTVGNLDAVLEELVRKEILLLHSDRFSPERGQFRFVQALVRQVAYETLSRRDRKARHLRVAEYLQSTGEGDEFAAIVARHYLDALENGPDDDDAPQLRAEVLERLRAAGQRAESLGSFDEALRHYSTALTTEPSPSDAAALHEGAARAAMLLNRLDDGIEHGRTASELYTSLGDRVGSGRAVAIQGSCLCIQLHYNAALELMLPAYEELEDNPAADDAVLDLAEYIARTYSMRNEGALAIPYADRAMKLAEGRQDWERIVSGLGRQATIWLVSGRPTGALALLRAAMEVGRQHHLQRAMILPLLNVACFVKNRDIDAAISAVSEAVELCDEANVAGELRRSSVLNLALTQWISGDWDGIEDLGETYWDDDSWTPVDHMTMRSLVAMVRLERGEPIPEDVSIPQLPEEREFYGDYLAMLITGTIAKTQGDLAGAAAAFGSSFAISYQQSGTDDDTALLFPLAVEAALAAGQVEEARQMVTTVETHPAGLITPLANAYMLRLRGLVRAARGEAPIDIDADLQAATQALRELRIPFDLGKVLLEQGRRAVERGDTEAAAALLADAESELKPLRANRALAEVRELTAALPAETPVS